MSKLHERLLEFQTAYRFKGKGPLAVALVVTHQAKQLPFPLKPAEMLADSRGQVAGLGKSTVQGILKAHSIDRELAKEGGRTSRGSVRNMELYAAFLNDLHGQGLLDLDEVERSFRERCHVQSLRSHVVSGSQSPAQPRINAMEPYDDNLLAHVESPWRPEWAWGWDSWEDEPVPIEQFTQEHEQAEQWTAVLGSWCNG